MAASGKQARDEWSGDLTGRHVSHFTVLSQSTATQGGRRLCICECECDCGDTFTRSACEIRYAARRLQNGIGNHHLHISERETR